MKNVATVLSQVIIGGRGQAQELKPARGRKAPEVASGSAVNQGCSPVNQAAPQLLKAPQQESQPPSTQAQPLALRNGSFGATLTVLKWGRKKSTHSSLNRVRNTSREAPLEPPPIPCANFFAQATSQKWKWPSCPDPPPSSLGGFAPVEWNPAIKRGGEIQSLSLLLKMPKSQTESQSSKLAR